MVPAPKLSKVSLSEKQWQLGLSVFWSITIWTTSTCRPNVGVMSVSIKQCECKMSVSQMFVGQILIGQMSFGQMVFDQMFFGQMLVDQRSFSQMFFYQMLGCQMFVDQKSVGQMFVCQMSFGRMVSTKCLSDKCFLTKRRVVSGSKLCFVWPHNISYSFYLWSGKF